MAFTGGALFFQFLVIGSTLFGARVQEPSFAPQMFVALGGDSKAIRLAKLEEINDLQSFEAKARGLGFLLKIEHGIPYLIHKDQAISPTAKPLQVILGEVKGRGLPTFLSAATSPVLAKSIRSLLAESRLGSDIESVEGVADSALTVHVGISISCDVVVQGRTESIRWMSSDETKDATYPLDSDLKPKVVAKAAELESSDVLGLFFSSKVPLGFRKSFGVRVLQIALEMEEEANKPIMTFGNMIVQDFMKRLVGVPGWEKKAECRADELPEALGKLLIDAYQMSRKFGGTEGDKDLLVEREAQFRSSTIKNLRAKIMLTTGVKKDGGTSMRTLSLETLLKG